MDKAEHRDDTEVTFERNPKIKVAADQVRACVRPCMRACVRACDGLDLTFRCTARGEMHAHSSAGLMLSPNCCTATLIRFQPPLAAKLLPLADVAGLHLHPEDKESLSIL